MRGQSTSPATTMRAVLYRRFGSPDLLSLEEVPRPEPGDTEVLIKVHATTVGPPDCAARAADPAYARLAYGVIKPKYPVLGSMAAGASRWRMPPTPRYVDTGRKKGAAVALPPAAFLGPRGRPRG